MAKKNRKKQPSNQTKKKNASALKLWGAAIVVIAVIVGGWNFYSSQKQQSLFKEAQASGIYRGVSMMHEVRLDQKSYQFREQKPVLNPMRYRQTRQIAAYGIAKQIPEVLDQLFCFCGCAMSIGHKSLLSCFTDDHAANCGVCMDEAEIADKMIKEGKTLPEIVDAIDNRFG